MFSESDLEITARVIGHLTLEKMLLDAGMDADGVQTAAEKTRKTERVKTVNKSQLRTIIPPIKGGRSGPERVNQFVDHDLFPAPIEDNGSRGRNDRRKWEYNQALRDAIEAIVDEEEKEKDRKARRL